jgi:hypothetical protein
VNLHSLWLALEEGRWKPDHWLVLADALDDGGDDKTAHACRWCGHRQKRPLCVVQKPNNQRYWYWLKDGLGGGAEVIGWRNRHPDSALSRVIFGLLPVVTSRQWAWEGRSFRECVEALGDSLAIIRLLIEAKP